MNNLTLTQPDDWHCHLRDGLYLHRTVHDSATRFGRVLVMPNLDPPILTIDAAKAYRDRILAAMPKTQQFEPLMTLYLSETMSPNIIKAAKDSGFIYAAKLYPHAATTNAQYGVKNIKKIYPLLAEMEKHNLVLCIHGESVEKNLDIFERETTFIETIFTHLMNDFPKLKIVLEHISTAAAVKFIEKAPKNVAATITPHHLLLNRNDLLQGGLNPYHYCLPILKTSHDQQALIQAAISGNPKFFLGTDSAPHTKNQKECACARAGIYSAHAAIEIYAMIFEQHHALDKLEAFASFYGADFYGVSHNSNKITLTKKNHTIADQLEFGKEVLIPLLANQNVTWMMA